MARKTHSVIHTNPLSDFGIEERTNIDIAMHRSTTASGFAILAFVISVIALIVTLME